MRAKPHHAIVEETGSTNRVGVRVTFDRGGDATVETRGSEKKEIKLPQDICERFFDDLQPAGSLRDIRAGRCAKSASFGSSLFIEANNERSPDMTCLAGDDSHTQALHRDATEIVQAARTRAGIPAFGRRVPMASPGSK